MNHLISIQGCFLQTSVILLYSPINTKRGKTYLPKFQSITREENRLKISHQKGSSDHNIMEGLIPFVLHALKKKRERSKYSSLKEGSSHSCRHPLTENVVGFDLDGSSHRRTRSDFQMPASGFVGWGGSSSASDFSAWNGMRDSSQQKQQKNIEMNGKQSQKA